MKTLKNKPYTYIKASADKSPHLSQVTHFVRCSEKRLTNKNQFSLLIISITIITIACLNLYLNTQKNSSFNQTKKENYIKAQSNKKLIKFSIKQQKYNLNNMLILMQKYRTIERSFYSNFQNFLKNKNNHNDLNQTLNNFIKEKSNFKKHFNRIRKNSSLKYYFKIIEKNIDGLEEMIEKFKLFSEKNQKETNLKIQKLAQNFF